MTPTEEQIVRAIGIRFRTFGGGRDSDSNPLAHALKDSPLVFAAGVDVREVVAFILRLHSAPPEPVDAVGQRSDSPI